MNRKHIIVCLVISLFMFACHKDDIVENTIFGFFKSDHFPEPVFNFDKNPISKEKFDLGKKLFYDGILSRNNSISCGSCHISYHAFTHHGHDVSHGIDDRLGTRNSMPLMNLAWSTSFFWDGGVKQLDLTPIVPIENHLEMDEKFSNIIQKLQKHKDYPKLFKAAFGTDEIAGNQILQALGQFMVILVSDQSKYDLVKKGKAQFTESEAKGYQVFKDQCATCHVEPLFTDYSFRNNGLEKNNIDDQGRYQITQNINDKYKFKVPSLRNLKYTAPYMHDGRFLTLQAAITHYRNGVQNTPNLDPILSSIHTLGLPITTEDINALLAFLNTLNDDKFIQNPLFAE